MIQCEIAAAAYIFETTDHDRARVDGELEKLKQFDRGAMTYFIVKGALTHLHERGVNWSNVKEYMDRRIQEFEETARKRTAAT